MEHSKNRYFQIGILRCTNGTDFGADVCQSNSDIDQVIDSTVVFLLLKNNYFDFNNFESPVNQFFQRDIIPLKSDTDKFVELNAKKNDYILRDSLTQFSQQEHTFYSFKDK